MRIDFTYKPDGQIETIQRFSTLIGSVEVAYTSYTYDTSGRLTSIHHREPDNDNIAYYTYTYDNHSRLTSIQRNGSLTTYVYDNTDQLTADGTNTFTYDANGNRTSGSYDTDPGNRLVTDGIWTYTYDTEGNLTKKSQGLSDETWTYGFDQRNQLVWAKHAGTDGGAVDLQVDFKYDAFGNRIEKAHDADGAGGGSAVVTRFALDGWKNVRQPLVGNENWDVWADLDGSSSLTTRYVRGDVIDQLFARIEEDAGGDIPYWYLTDHLGSIRDVIDGSAVVKNSITYDGFGNITAETDSNYRGRYAWTRREIDAELELQYNRARYYDAHTGRWISQDPMGFNAGDNNLYRYVANSPTLAIDPSGLLPQLEVEKPYDDFGGHGGVFFIGHNFKLTEPSDRKKGGYVIERVQFAGSGQTVAKKTVEARDVFNQWRMWKVLPGKTTAVGEIQSVLPAMQSYLNTLTQLVNQAKNQTLQWKPGGDHHAFYSGIRDEFQKVIADAKKAERRNSNIFWIETGFPAVKKNPGGAVKVVPAGRIIRSAQRPFLTLYREAYYLDCVSRMPRGLNAQGGAYQRTPAIDQAIDRLKAHAKHISDQERSLYLLSFDLSGDLITDWRTTL